MRRLVSTLLACLAVSALAGDREGHLPAGRIIDLTHAFDADTVFWPTADGFELDIDFRGETDGGFWYEANTFRTAEHGGTHLDAPVHFAHGAHATHEIPLDRLVGPAVVIDISSGAAADRDYEASVDDVLDWEREHGRLPDGIILLFRTGFAQFWPDRERYMGTAKRGAEGVAELRFPGIHPDLARWLVAERKIHAVGIDTPSIDHGPSTAFETHQVLFRKNIPAFENVASMAELPATGFTVVALPMKIRDGSGGPLRIIAILP